jgi:hypothetical protein
MRNAYLKHLLALSNQNTEEAREAALAADNELKSKEAEPEDAVYRLWQAEEELRSAALSVSHYSGTCSNLRAISFRRKIYHAEESLTPNKELYGLMTSTVRALLLDH